jgi:hypothetical protein
MQFQHILLEAAQLIFGQLVGKNSQDLLLVLLRLFLLHPELLLNAFIVIGDLPQALSGGRVTSLQGQHCTSFPQA